METFATLAEAREGKGKREAGDRRAASREPFEDYARQWIVTYKGRTSRGLSERTRDIYRRDMERWIIPYFRAAGWRRSIRQTYGRSIGHLDDAGLRANSIRSILAPLKAMYATAVRTGRSVESHRQRPHPHQSPR